MEVKIKATTVLNIIAIAFVFSVAVRFCVEGNADAGLGWLAASLGMVVTTHLRTQLNNLKEKLNEQH